MGGEDNGTPLQYSCLENPWMEEPGRLQSMGPLRVRHDWVTSLSLFTFMCWRRKWQPTPVFLPGESQGRGTPVGGWWGPTLGASTSSLHAPSPLDICLPPLKPSVCHFFMGRLNHSSLRSLPAAELMTYSLKVPGIFPTPTPQHHTPRRISQMNWKKSPFLKIFTSEESSGEADIAGRKEDNKGTPVT